MPERPAVGGDPPTTGESAATGISPESGPLTGGPGFLLIETRTGPASDRFLGDGRTLAGTGQPVRLLLVADAVATAVRGASEPLAGFLRAGGTLWVDDLTLAQRALPARVLVEGAAVVSMDTVADALLSDGVRTVWH